MYGLRRTWSSPPVASRRRVRAGPHIVMRTARTHLSVSVFVGVHICTYVSTLCRELLLRPLTSAHTKPTSQQAAAARALYIGHTVTHVYIPCLVKHYRSVQSVCTAFCIPGCSREALVAVVCHVAGLALSFQLCHTQVQFPFLLFCTSVFRPEPLHLLFE